MFSKLTHNMFKNKKIWITLIATTLLVIPLVTHAQDTLSSSNEIKSLFNNLNIILLALQAFLWPILLLLGSLLNNDLLFSGGMQTILLNIWTAVRDFVNIMFVLGLLAIAIANIMGSDKVPLKTVLPSIVIALIAVNFSFLACKVILDVVNVTSTAIFSIPIASDSLKKYTDPATKDTALTALSEKVCDKMSKLQASGSTTTPGKPAAASTTNAFCTQSTGGDPTKQQLTDLGKSFFSTFNSRNAALVMAIELQDIVNLDTLPKDKITTLKDLAINTIFSIIFFVIYATAFVALFAAMLIRVVVLWLAIAISPLSFLGLAFKNVKEKFGKNDPFFELFMKHALIPLPVSLVLTVGMIMISQLKNISGNSITSTDPASLGAITTGMSTVQDIIAGLATAAFIWIAAFMALEGTKADIIVNPIRDTVKGFGMSLAKLPLYAPILPVSGGKPGERVGLAALTSGLSGPQQYINAQTSRYQTLFGDKSGANITALKGATTASQAKPLVGTAINEALKVGDKPNLETSKAIAETLRKYKSNYNIVLPPGFKGTQEDFFKALEAGTVSREQYKEFMEKNQSFEPPASPNKDIRDKANKALEAGKSTNAEYNAGELNTAIGKLEDVNNKLAAPDIAGKPAEMARLIADAKTTTASITKLTELRDNFAGVKLDTSIIKDNKMTDKTKMGALKAYTDTIAPVGSPATVKDEAKNILIKKIKADMPSMPDLDASKLADSIMNGQTATPGGPVPPPPVPVGPPIAPAP